MPTQAHARMHARTLCRAGTSSPVLLFPLFVAHLWRCFCFYIFSNTFTWQRKNGHFGLWNLGDCVLGKLRLKANYQKKNGVSTYHMVFMLNKCIQIGGDGLPLRLFINFVLSFWTEAESEVDNRKKHMVAQSPCNAEHGEMFVWATCIAEFIRVGQGHPWAGCAVSRRGLTMPLLNKLGGS